jgi:hypothetical protein
MCRQGSFDAIGTDTGEFGPSCSGLVSIRRSHFDNTLIESSSGGVFTAKFGDEREYIK